MPDESIHESIVSGYYVIGSKFYCDIHAKQLSQDHFKATPPIDPNLFYSRAPPLDVSPLKVEPIKAP
uniref:Uncharacterized protein n=1 Tax=Romanomermis culicivorax TaxID=13658 RepID=A0A915HEN6_ROMCU